MVLAKEIQSFDHHHLGAPVFFLGLALSGSRFARLSRHPSSAEEGYFRLFLGKLLRVNAPEGIHVDEPGSSSQQVRG